MPNYGNNWEVRCCPVQPQQITAAASLCSDHLLGQAVVRGREDRAQRRMARHQGLECGIQRVDVERAGHHGKGVLGEVGVGHAPRIFGEEPRGFDDVARVEQAALRRVDGGANRCRGDRSRSADIGPLR